MNHLAAKFRPTTQKGKHIPSTQTTNSRFNPGSADNPMPKKSVSSMLEARDPSRRLTRHFGTRVRMIREDRGWTQARLALHLGIDRSFISEVERGRKSCTLSIVEVFAHGFKMTVADMFKDL